MPGSPYARSLPVVATGSIQVADDDDPGHHRGPGQAGTGWSFAGPGWPQRSSAHLGCRQERAGVLAAGLCLAPAVVGRRAGRVTVTRRPPPATGAAVASPAWAGIG